MNRVRHLRIIAGDIGDDQREYTFEPLTTPVEPITVPTPAPVEAPEREGVPA